VTGGADGACVTDVTVRDSIVVRWVVRGASSNFTGVVREIAYACAVNSDRTDTPQSLDGLVGAWLTVPDVAERLGIDAGKVRRLIQERKLLAVRRGEPPVMSIPADFLVPEHLANPANVQARTSAASAILSSLAGTLTILGDVGFSDAGAIRWLFTEDDALQTTPLAALRTGRKTEVRRRAQLEL